MAMLFAFRRTRRSLTSWFGLRGLASRRLCLRRFGLLGTFDGGGRRWSRRVLSRFYWCFVNRDEPHFVPNPVITENLGDGDVRVGAEPLGHVRHGGRYIKMKRRAQPAEWRPFGQRFEVVDRLDRL